MPLRIAAALLALAVSAPAQAPEAEPPKLTLPKPAPPARPKPTTVYIPPPKSKLDEALLYSQMVLAGTGTGATTAAHITRFQDQSSATIFTAVGAVGAGIVMERIFEDEMSDKAKKWVIVSNMAASTVLAVLMGRDIRISRRKLRVVVPEKPPVIVVTVTQN